MLLIDIVVNKPKALIQSGRDGLTDPNVNGRTGEELWLG